MNPYILKTNNAVKKIVVILYVHYRYQVLIKAKFFECEKPITDNECQQAILQLANNKSPGLDGFSIDFIKLSGLKLRVYLWNALIFPKLPTN